MQAFNSGPAPTETGKVEEWHILALSYRCEHKYGYVHDTHSLKKTKEYHVFDSFSTQPRQLLTVSAVFFFCTVKMWDILYDAAYFLYFFFTCSTIFLSLCHVFQPPSDNIFLVFFLCLVLAVVLPSPLSTMTTMLPPGLRLPFIQHFLLFLFAHSLAHAAAQLCQTHVVRPKHP